MIKNGIDISHWNNIYSALYIANEVDFVILKAGGSDGKGGKQYKDQCFDNYYQELKKYGVPLGAYYFVGRFCITPEKGKEDAQHFLTLLKGKKFEYPVICDLESTSPKDRSGATEAVKAFCDVLEDAGYYAMIYASDISGFKERLNIDLLIGYDKWVARYGSNPTYLKKYGMYQYSSTGNIRGIQGKVDLDRAYKDYPAIIKAHHLNGF